MRIATALLLIGSLTTALGATANASPTTAGVRAFLSPSHNISCELDEAAPPGTQGSAALAYCQSSSPPRSVSMDAFGSITPCAGDSCMGDPALGTPTLAYGQTVRHGPRKK